MESGDQIRGDSSSVDQILGDLHCRASPYHLPLTARQREIEEAVPTAAVAAALRSRPPLQAAQRDDATPPRLRVRRATMETGDGVYLREEKCWENTAANQQIFSPQWEKG